MFVKQAICCYFYPQFDAQAEVTGMMLRILLIEEPKLEE